MNALQRDKLAFKFGQTWPHGPDQSIWATTFDDEGLDYAQTEQAYAKMRNDEERPPSIARFLVVYRTFSEHRPVWHPTYGEAISFDEHIRRLGVKADAGDRNAAAELDVWADNEAKGLSVRGMGWRK